MTYKNCSKQYSNYIRWILPLIIWGILMITSRDLLRQIEARSLFLFDWFWIKGFTVKPGGILACLSLFFAQFMHLPWLGSLIWVILLALSARFTLKTFRISAERSILSWIPAFILLGANMSLGYLVFIMNRQSYFFEPLIGYLFIIAATSLISREQKILKQTILIAIWGIAGYWAIGYYAFAGITVALAYSLCCSDRTNRPLIQIATAVVVILAAPLLFYGLTTYNLSQGWILGLPTALYKETHMRTCLPIVAVTLVPIILSIFKNRIRTAPTRPFLFQSSILITCAILLFFSWFKDYNFHAEISMIEATDNLEWNKSVAIMQRISSKADKKKDYQPTRVMVTLKDLALIKTGRESTQAFAFDDGSQKQKRSYDIPMVLEIGKMLYLHYGIPGFCHRWCLEETGEFGWSYKGLEYLTMASISMNDRLLTSKYLDMLDHTLFYKGWSKKQRNLISDRAKIANTAPYNTIFPLICHDDQLWDDQRGCEPTLSVHFLGPRPQNATPLYDRVALFWALKAQDIGAFWNKLFLYLESNNIEKMDRCYQEAAYLFSHIENDQTLMALPYDNMTANLFSAFVNAAQKHEFDIHGLNDARQTIPQHLRYTYYYYYSFVKGIELF